MTRYSQRQLPIQAFEPGAGRVCAAELDVDREGALGFGLDLFNHGFFWEAHEVWEGLWRGLERDSREARGVRGLIQCAAAALKRKQGQAKGGASLGQKAQVELGAAGELLEWAGLVIQLGDFAREFEVWLGGARDESLPPGIVADKLAHP